MRNPLQNPSPENFVQIQLIQLHVADMTAAGLVAAPPCAQRFSKIGIVDVAERRRNKMTTAHRACAIYGNHCFPRSTALAEACVLLLVEWEERINRSEKLKLVRRVIVRLALVRLDPQINV